jgi:hypothetical protein
VSPLAGVAPARKGVLLGVAAQLGALEGLTAEVGVGTVTLGRRGARSWCGVRTEFRSGRWGVRRSEGGAGKMLSSEEGRRRLVSLAALYLGLS